MKRLHFCLFVFTYFSINCYSQQGKPINFSEVIKLDSTISTEELFSRARGWYVSTFKSTKDALQIQDKRAGELIGKGSLVYYSSQGALSSANGHINFTIKFFLKDGRYKYDFSDFFHTGTKNNYGNSSDFGLITEDEDCPYRVFTTNLNWKKWTNKNWKDIKTFISKSIPTITNDLNKAMTQPTSGNNW